MYTVFINSAKKDYFFFSAVNVLLLQHHFLYGGALHFAQGIRLAPVQLIDTVHNGNLSVSSIDQQTTTSL